MDEGGGGHGTVSLEGRVRVFTACVINDYSSVGPDTKPGDAGRDAATLMLFQR